MIETDNLLSGEKQNNEELKITSVRPKVLDEYIGQDEVKS
jgi:Holliday junction resolvasome RuvABC ATP-dependent DNA helicase subunit